jgi:hypothetical protein
MIRIVPLAFWSSFPKTASRGRHRDGGARACPARGRSAARTLAAPDAYAAHEFAACDFPFSVTRLRVAIANAGVRADLAACPRTSPVGLRPSVAARLQGDGRCRPRDRLLCELAAVQIRKAETSHRRYDTVVRHASALLLACSHRVVRSCSIPQNPVRRLLRSAALPPQTERQRRPGRHHGYATR